MKGKNTIYFLKTKDIHIRHVRKKEAIYCYKYSPDIDLELLSGREFYYLEKNDEYSSKYKYIGDYGRFPAVKIEKDYYYLSKVKEDSNGLLGIFKLIHREDVCRIETDIF